MDKQKIIAIILVVLFGGCIIYEMTDECTMDNYIIYSIKTVGQTKHKLTVYTDREHVPIEIFQRMGDIRDLRAVEKEITCRKTNKNGIVVFHLPPGIYSCQGNGFYRGYTDVDLNSDREVRIRLSQMGPGR